MSPRLGNFFRASSGRTALATLALLLGHASTAKAEIVATSVTVHEMAVCPASIVAGDVGTPTSDVRIFAFEEQDNISLASVDVDITGPGIYDGTNPLTPGTIGDGCHVDVDYIHFQPVTPNTSLRGRVKFSDEIIGVIVEDVTHDNSNFLGCPVIPTDYGTCDGELCGMEVDTGQDTIVVGFDFIEVDFTAFSWGDRVRVITLLDPVGDQDCIPPVGED